MGRSKLNLLAQKIEELFKAFPDIEKLFAQIALPLLSSYADLAEPCYRGEVCIIGSQEIPDPLLALFVQKERGKAQASRLINNIVGFGAPVNAIRHIGKP